jgi:DNA-directed RNA polymerase subunit M/transcription elongation factor TFIIS
LSEEISPCPKCGELMFKEQDEGTTWYCPSCNVKYRTK